MIFKTDMEAFLSIYWPKDLNEVNDNIILTQDIFPTILSRITNNTSLFDELKIEEDFLIVSII